MYRGTRTLSQSRLNSGSVILYHADYQDNLCANACLQRRRGDIKLVGQVMMYSPFLYVNPHMSDIYLVLYLRVQQVTSTVCVILLQVRDDS